jgi:CRISP-associated protein Cas1
MNSVIISDYGVTLAKTGERLVIRGPRPRLELIEGGPQLLLPLGLDHKRPTLTVVTSDGVKTPPPPLHRSASGIDRPDPASLLVQSIASVNTQQSHDGPSTPLRAGSAAAPATSGDLFGYSGEPRPSVTGQSPEQGRASKGAKQSRDNGAAAHAGSLKNEQIELPLFRVSEIVISSPGVSISTDLIETCCERGIRLSFLTRAGKPYAMLSSPMLSATVSTRREQLAAYNDSRGVEIATTIVRGKLGNQAALLKYFGKYLKESNPPVFTELSVLVKSLSKGRADAARISEPNIDAAREALLSIEGLAGRTYWRGVRLLIPENLGFELRAHRGAPDPVNSALNYGYGILYTQLWGAIMNAGLEPFAGFLHVDRPGKPSLVLDMVEEFRQPVVDRAVIAAIGRGTAIETREGMLTDGSRRAIAAAVMERIESEVNFRGRRHKLKSVIQTQARNLASFLRGSDKYRTFAFKW